ncbi:MAG: RHS repeat-associated core domain-containing protein [Phycisphaerales bacterium]
MIAQQFDAFGNVWTYDYDEVLLSLTSSGSSPTPIPAPRLKHVFLHGTHAADPRMRARLDFHWDFSYDIEDQPGAYVRRPDMLRSVDVVRFVEIGQTTPPTRVECVTDSVVYTYVFDLLDLAPGGHSVANINAARYLGSPACLVMATRRTLLNAPLAGAPHTRAPEPAQIHDRVSVYRYEIIGNQIVGLKAIYYPQQLEYMATNATENLRTPGSLEESIPEGNEVLVAAVRLLQMDETFPTDVVHLRDPATGITSEWNAKQLAGKWVIYNPYSKEMSAQLVTGGGAVGLTLREDHGVAVSPMNSQITFDGGYSIGLPNYSRVIHERECDRDGHPRLRADGSAEPPLRTKIYRNEQRIIHTVREDPSQQRSWSAVYWTPFTTAEATFEYNADGSVRKVWATGYEYDNRNRPTVRRLSSSLLSGVTAVPQPSLPGTGEYFSFQPENREADTLDFMMAPTRVAEPSVPGYLRTQFKPHSQGICERTEYRDWDEDIAAGGVAYGEWIASTYGQLASLQVAARYILTGSLTYKVEENTYLPLASWRPDLQSSHKQFSGVTGEPPLTTLNEFTLERIWGHDSLVGSASPRTKIVRIATAASFSPPDGETENAYATGNHGAPKSVKGYSTSGNVVWELARNSRLDVHVYDDSTGARILSLSAAPRAPVIEGYANPVVNGPHGRALGGWGPIVLFNTELGSIMSLSRVDVLGRERTSIAETSFLRSTGDSGGHYTYTLTGGGIVTETEFGIEPQVWLWRDSESTSRARTYVETRRGGYATENLWYGTVWLGSCTRTYLDSAMDVVAEESREGGNYYAGTTLSRRESVFDLAGRETISCDWWLPISPAISDVNGVIVHTTEFDALGRTIRVTNANGEVTETSYDAKDRPVEVRIAANSALIGQPAQCAITTNFYDYDAGNPTRTRGGEGLLTYVRQTVGGGAPDRIRRLFYNNLLHPIAEVSVSSLAVNAAPVGPWKLTVSDLIGRPRETGTASSDLPITTVASQLTPFTAAINQGLDGFPNLNSQEKTYYSSGRGLAYRSESAIHPGNWAAGALRTDRWYDSMGDLTITRPPAACMTASYRDILGRTTDEVTTWPDPQHDPIGLGSLIPQPALKKVHHTYYQQSAALSQTATYISSPSTDLPGITTYTGYVYDPLHRRIATIDYGHGIQTTSASDPTISPASQSLSASAAAPTPIPMQTEISSEWYIDGSGSPIRPVPAGFLAANPGVIITRQSYNAIGQPQDSVDPLGRVTRALYDGLGRGVGIIENARTSRDGLWNYNVSPEWIPETDSVPGHWGVDDSDLPANLAPDEYRVNTTVMDGLGNSVLRVAFQRPAIGDTSPAKQFSRFVYNIADTDGAFSSSGYRSASLLYEIRYPDPETGLPTTNDAHRIRYRYNQVGEQTAVLDQNGTTRLFTRDAVGRLLTDSVALPLAGSAVDTTAATIRNTYDTSGRVAATEMLDAAGLTLNKVSYEYDALGGVTALKQIAGFAGTNPLGGERIVRYDLQSFPRLDTAASGLSASYFNNWRGVLGLTYPDATPSSSTDDTELRLYADADHLSNLPATLIEAHHRFAISQPTLLSLRHGGADLGTTISNPTGVKLLANIRRLGMSRTVSMSLDIPQVHLDRVRSVTGQTSNGVYAGWDRFGRLKQQVWTPTAPPSPTSANANATPATGWLENAAALTPGQETRPLWQHGYGYSADSDRLWDDDLRPAFDGSVPDRRYTYDNLRRLTKEEKGRFSWPSNTQNFAAAAGSRSWSLDMLGNWKSVATDINGDGTFNPAETSTRQHDASNQLTELGAANGAPAIVRVYDNNGNLVSETVSGETTPFRRFIYDAWNRLVRVERREGAESPTNNTTKPVASYTYNALNWRVTERVRWPGDTDTLPNPSIPGYTRTRVFFFSSEWQALDVLEDRLAEPTLEPLVSSPFTPDSETQFLWGARDKDELLAVRTRALTNASGATINPPTPWTDPAVNTLYTLSDSALSVVAFVSPSGRIRESRLYDAYGNLSRHLLGDLNADGLVDDTDFGIFNAAYDLYDCAGTAGGDASAGVLGNTLTKWGCPADLNGDWVVDDADFSIFAAGYNQMIPEQDALVSGNAAGGGMLWGPGWTGAWYDPATGLWLSRNRWYDPLAGRWITRDPAGYVDGLSLYLYVKGNPFLFRDPSGLYSLGELAQIGWAGVRGAGSGAVNVAIGGAHAVAEVGRTAYDVGGTAIEVATDGNYHHNYASQVMQTYGNGGSWSEVAADSASLGGKMALSAGTAGASDVVTATFEGVRSGDYDTMSQSLGGTIANNGMQAGLIKGGQMLANRFKAPTGQSPVAEGPPSNSPPPTPEPASTTASGPVQPYEVAPADQLRARSVVGDDIAIHHVGQAHALEQTVPAYNRATGPAIALPTSEHLPIPNMKGQVNLSPRQILANDIRNLRQYSNAPNSSLKTLVDMNKNMYPEMKHR